MHFFKITTDVFKILENIEKMKSNEKNSENVDNENLQIREINSVTC